MSQPLAIYENWAQCDGQRVTIDGHVHTLRVRVYTARYPRVEKRITVDAHPVSRRSRYYREMREKLRDDWSVDVLATPETETEVWEQLPKEVQEAGLAALAV